MNKNFDRSERKIIFKNFRNLGIKKPEELILNRNLQKGEIGDVVLLIGPNNSGKSNILKGIEKFCNSEIENEDVFEGSPLYEIDSEPTISLVETIGEIEKRYSIGLNENFPLYSSNEENKQEEIKTQNFFSALKNLILNFQTFAIENQASILTYKQSRYEVQRVAYALNETFNIKAETFEVVLEKFTHRDVLRMVQCFNHFMPFIFERCTRENDEFYSIVFNKDYLIDSVWELLKNNFKSKVSSSYNLPKAFVYSEKQILSNNDLEVKELKFTTFIKDLLEFLGSNVFEIEEIYKRSLQFNNPGLLENIQNKVNKRMSDISKDFNSIYNSNSESYNFELRLTPERIYLVIKNNNIVAGLDNQSEGFKWFFNFYFNFLIKNKTKSGDIIIVDEAGSKLHPKAIEELKKFFKKHSIENDLTFVVATHSPFMIDTDALEEIKIVYSDPTNTCHIENEFMVSFSDNIIERIKNALTVERHVVMNPENEIFFVDSVSCYNYLTAFKNTNKDWNHFQFIPIKIPQQKNKNSFSELIEMLRKIRKNPKFILGSSKNSSDLKNFLDHLGYDVLDFEKLNKNWTRAESLFTKEDSFINQLNKEGENFSFAFKKNFLNFNISEPTINNFKTLFKSLQEIE